MLCLLAGLLAWWELREVRPAADLPGAGQAAAPAAKPAPVPAAVTSPAPASGAPPVDPLISTAPAAMPPVTPAPVSDVADEKAEKTGPRYKRAYMLSIDKGAVTFLEAQDIEGDFATGRQPLDEGSGMLRCRLLSETNAVLAEEVLPAPDYVCTALDQNSKPVTLNVQRPVVFQVRLPRVKGASRLNVYRIIQPGEQPLEGLLASIPLPPS